jgi:hypothetical protein
MHWLVFCAAVVTSLVVVLRVGAGAARVGWLPAAADRAPADGAEVAAGVGRLPMMAATVACTSLGLTRNTHPTLLIVLPSVGMFEKVMLPADISPNSASSDSGSSPGSIWIDDRTASSSLLILAGLRKVPVDAIFLNAWLRK